MTNFILDTVAAIVVSVVGFTFEGDVVMNKTHCLTVDEKCEIYEQLVDEFQINARN